MVVSKEPWFTEAEAQPMPTWRDGLWRADEPDCRFDERKPVERWPECAEPTVVRDGERWSMRWDETDERGRRRRTFAGWELDKSDEDGLLVANGDHLIVQVPTDLENPEETVEHGEAPGGYTYAAVRPRYDDERRIVSFEIWAVQCGPLPEPALPPNARRRGRAAPDESLGEASVTTQPFPGLTVVDSNCEAESAQALRRAAVLSETLGQAAKSHWVREGWR
jgi:hypothetical protein